MKCYCINQFETSFNLVTIWRGYVSCQNKSKERQMFKLTKKDIQNGIYAMFPSISTFEKFINKNACLSDIETILKIVDIPIDDFKESLINTQEIGIDSNIKSLNDFFKKFGLKKRNLIEQVNKSIEEINKQKDLRPLSKILIKLNSSIFTRINNDGVGSSKRSVREDALRTLSFFIPQLKIANKKEFSLYNYDYLFSLCEAKTSIEIGARIALTLNGAEGVPIDNSINQLYKLVKFIIKKENCNNITSIWKYSDNVIFIDIIKQNKGLNSPDNYKKEILMSINLVYTISINFIAEQETTETYKLLRLSIGISANHDDRKNHHLIEIIKLKKIFDIVKVTEFSLSCIKTNDIRITTSSKPYIIDLATGSFKIYTIFLDGYYNIYCNIPDLIKKDRLLQSDNELMDLLYEKKIKDNHSKSTVITFLNDPKGQNLLGVEIGKTLFYRKKYYEADHIVNLILSNDNSNLNARFLKLCLLCSSALYSYEKTASLNLSIAFFETFIYQVEKILPQTHLSIFSYEDVKCEIGLGFLSYGWMILKDNQLPKDKGIEKFLLAEKYFTEGLSISQSPARSIYLLIIVKSLQCFLQYNNILSDSIKKEQIQLYRSIIVKKAKEVFSIVGFYRLDIDDENKRMQILNIRIREIISLHEISSFLNSYKANMYFCFACVLIDFYSVSVKRETVKHALYYLQESKRIAESLEGDMCIYSTIRIHAEIIESHLFIKHINKCISQLQRLLEKDISAQSIDIDFILCMLTLFEPPKV